MTLVPDNATGTITAVYDTNVLISGLFCPGKPRQLIRLARSGRVNVFTCGELLDELRDVLTRSSKAFRLSTAEAAAVIEDVMTYAQLVTPAREVSVCRDPNDNIVLACALASSAEYIVTGDPDLLVLKEFEGVTIVRVADFAALNM